jgi:GT2 family glycosyltransferase
VTRSVTAVFVAYGEVPLLHEAVERVLASAGVDVDVVVVDHGATAALPSGSDRVRVVRPPTNSGFGGGCNAGAAVARADFLAFVNPDVLVDPEALVRLAEVAARPDVGIATASVRLLREPDLLNSAGGAIHFLGLGWADGFRDPVASASCERSVAAASGAAMVMRREVFEAVGGFTPELFLYHEDAELSLRCRLAGYDVRFVPDAVALHDYEFGRNTGKMLLLERNRLVLVLTAYAGRTLVLLAPALIVYEMGMVALSVAQGWFPEKIRGWAWLARHVGWLRAQRRRVAALRVRTDRDIAPFLAAHFTGRQVEFPAVLRPADALLAGYWRLVRRWL